MCKKKSGVAVKSGDEVVVYTLPGNDRHTDIREKHNLRDDVSLMARYQVPVEFIPVRGLFEIEDYEFAFDESRPEWWTDAMTESAKKQLFRAAMDEWDGKTLKVDRDINFSSLISIPEGVTLEAGWNIYLDSLTSMCEGVTLKAGWNIYLDSLTSMGGGVTLEAGWCIYAIGKWWDSASELRKAMNG